MKTLYKYFLSIFIFITTMLLAGCPQGGRRMLIGDTSSKADAMIDQIIEFVNNRDSDGLKELFSKQVLNDIEDIDIQIEQLFCFIQGEIKYREENTGIGESSSVDYGKRKKSYIAPYVINTNEEVYYFYIIERLINTENPDDVGLYMIRAIKADDRYTPPNGEYWENRAGIYIPIPSDK